MSTPRVHRVTTRALAFLAAALGLSIVSYALGDFWSILLAVLRSPASATYTLHTFWIPLVGVAVTAATAILGAVGFLLVWRGRWELGGEYASRVGLAMLAALVATVAYALYAFTGILLGSFAGLEALVPWRGLFAVVGGVAVGFALYWIIANLPVSGTRPVAVVALALGLAGIALLNLAVLDLRRARIAGLEGAGIGFALASLVLWLVLCLHGEETLRTGPSRAAATKATEGS